VATKRLWGIALVKGFLGYFAYYLHGKIDLAYQTTVEAVQLADESGDVYSKAATYTCHGVSCFGKGFMKEAVTHLLHGVDFSERIDYIFMNAIAQHFLAEVFFEKGEYRKSEDHYYKAVRNIEERRGMTSWENLNRIGAARAKVNGAEKEIEVEILLGYVSQNEQKIYESRMARYIAEILLNLDDKHFTESEEWAEKAIEADMRNGMMFYLGKDYTLYAEVLKRKGDQSKVKENLNKAIEIFKECGADGWVKKTEEKRGTLSC
jgi:tetratricopeptide (TPR) repeat protein